MEHASRQSAQRTVNRTGRRLIVIASAMVLVTSCAYTQGTKNGVVGRGKGKTTPEQPVVAPAQTTATTAPVTSPPTTAAPIPGATTPSSLAPTTAPTTVATTAPVTSPPSTTPTVTGSQPSIASNFDIGPYMTTGGGIPASSASEPSGNFRFTCGFSHLSYDDPIVFPGQPGKAHLHMFFGNTMTNAFSTYNSLRQNGGGTCDGGPINRSGYWAPAVFNAAGQVVVPDYISVYYKGPGRDAAGRLINDAVMPAGLRMIAGYDMARPSTSTHFEWYCEYGQVKQQTIPRCAAGERVGVKLEYPVCWDGANLDAGDHRSHVVYKSSDPTTGIVRCPATHPIQLPRLEIGIWFTHDGNSNNWYLSSDRMPGMVHANGSTFHADWFGAWDPTIMQTFVSRCINGLLDCKAGQLGDGTALKLAPWYSGPKLLNPPPPPS